jgi:hypothetical protein
VRERYLSRSRPTSAADQPCVRNRVVRRAEGSLLKEWRSARQHVAHRIDARHFQGFLESTIQEELMALTAPGVSYPLLEGHAILLDTCRANWRLRSVAGRVRLEKVDLQSLVRRPIALRSRICLSHSGIYSKTNCVLR